MGKPPLKTFIFFFYLCWGSLCLLGISSCDSSAPSQPSRTPIQKTTTNYAPNGHAEKGLPGWGGIGNALISVSSNTAHAGMYSIYVGSRTEAWHGVSYTPEALQVGESYEITAWVKLAPGEEDSDLTLTLRIRAEETIYVNLATVTATSKQWTLIRSKFTHPPGTLDYAYIESPNPTASYYVDDLSLVGQYKVHHNRSSASPSFTAGKAKFNWFEVEGADDAFSTPLKEGHATNPILSGFHPDASILRVKDDYYLTHASHGFWPSVPIYHSKDLVNWQLISHGITNPDSIELKDRQVSEGIFASSIRFHEGTYYIVSTAVWSGGNFIITAKHPQGPWSPPKFFTELKGIDPDLFFDDDGQVYLVHNAPPLGAPHYSGHRAIWLWKFDLDKLEPIVGSERLLINGGVNFADRPQWIQGPRLFKKDGWYYLSCAEGGNGENQSQVIFRTQSLDTEFEPAPNNPILTQADLKTGRKNPIIAAGHADFVQTPEGKWWAIFSGTRPYDELYYNIGRETYLHPVTWKDGWPTILPPQTTIPYQLAVADLKRDTHNATPLTGNFIWRDTFDKTPLDNHWQSLRTSFEPWSHVNVENQQLEITAQPSTIAERGAPAFISRALQHLRFHVKTSLSLPLKPGISAGLAAFQSTKYHYFLGVRKHGEEYQIFIEQAAGSAPVVLEQITIPVTQDAITLSMSGDNGELSFGYTLDNQSTIVAEDVNGRILSRNIAGSVVGTHIGLYVRGH